MSETTAVFLLFWFRFLFFSSLKRIENEQVFFKKVFVRLWKLLSGSATTYKAIIRYCVFSRSKTSFTSVFNLQNFFVKDCFIRLINGCVVGVIESICIYYRLPITSLSIYRLWCIRYALYSIRSCADIFFIFSISSG